MAKNPRLIDISRQRFGLWTVLEKAGNTSRGAALWLCACECGTRRKVIGVDLRNGKSTSCGCLGAERIGALRRTHGASNTPLYSVWQAMRNRCRNPEYREFHYYGGRGIDVCPEWESFPAFHEWALASGYDNSLSIERKDVNGDYCPNNCTWADASIQSANRRFVRRAPDGQLWLHKALANGITRDAYYARIKAAWPPEEAVTWPMGIKRFERPRDEKGRFL